MMKKMRKMLKSNLQNWPLEDSDTIWNCRKELCLQKRNNWSTNWKSATQRPVNPFQRMTRLLRLRCKSEDFQMTKKFAIIQQSRNKSRGCRKKMRKSWDVTKSSNVRKKLIDWRKIENNGSNPEARRGVWHMGDQKLPKSFSPSRTSNNTRSITHPATWAHFPTLYLWPFTYYII